MQGDILSADLQIAAVKDSTSFKSEQGRSTCKHTDGITLTFMHEEDGLVSTLAFCNAYCLHRLLATYSRHSVHIFMIISSTPTMRHFSCLQTSFGEAGIRHNSKLAQFSVFIRIPLRC